MATTTRIEKLTPEQEARLPEFRDKWLAIGLATGPADRVAAEKACKMAYEVAKLAPPKTIYWADSPFQGLVMAAALSLNMDPNQALIAAKTGLPDNLKEATREQLSHVFYGQHTASWLSYMDYFGEVCGLECTDSLHPLMELAQQASWCWFFDKAAVVTERPNELHRDEMGRLHNPNGPAIRYGDDAMYFWRGTSVPAEWITDKESVDPSIALTWPNIEQRRALAEIIGWARILDTLKPTIIDEDEDPEIGTLLAVDIPDSPNTRFLKVVCGTKRTFVLPVPSTMETALQANAWTYGLKASELKLEYRT